MQLKNRRNFLFVSNYVMKECVVDKEFQKKKKGFDKNEGQIGAK